MNSAFCVAVHALICLNRRQEQLSSEELARSICTNPARVRKIMAGLKRAGLVETKEGNEGGYRFVGDPAALTLDQVARALEVRFVSTNWRGGGVDQPPRAISWRMKPPAPACPASLRWAMPALRRCARSSPQWQTGPWRPTMRRSSCWRML